MGDSEHPTLMYAMRARFLTRPTACPSGVSAGQMNPQCVLCSCRGLACKSIPVESSRPGHVTRQKSKETRGEFFLLIPVELAALTFLQTIYLTFLIVSIILQ